LSYVAADEKGRIVGYIFSENEPSPHVHGHVTSISVLRSYRTQSRKCVASTNAEFVSLHVRKTNRAALALYKDSLGFELAGVEKAYYGDGEDALQMKMQL
ncbi:hypothetical protein BT69DRAFT_1282038, partial [Atractiella rhizophila]